jgi:glycosyltransferase involved in cell wall biosynthesis
MHVALITDTAYLEEDAAAFRLLGVGLVDQGLRVTQVLPSASGFPGNPGAGAAFGARLTWQDSDWGIVRRKRLAALAPELERLETDLIHVLGGRLWRGARTLADRLQVPAVLECSSLRHLDSLKDIRQAAAAGRIAFAAATQPLAKELADHLGAEAIVRFIPPGIHLPVEINPIPRHPEARCLLVHGDGTLDDDYLALFDALGTVLAQQPQVQVFLDNPGNEGHELWQAARRAGLLPWMNQVPRHLGRRELLLAADLLVQPQALGGARSLTLAAMAHGLPVMARRDPWVDYLLPDQTAWLVERGEAAEWGGLLGAFLGDPAAGQALGLRARQWVAQNRRASEQIANTVALYRQVTGESMRFPAAKA